MRENRKIIPLMKRKIIIMAKVPHAGNVKTRLQPFLSPQECRALAETFLFDAIRKGAKLLRQTNRRLFARRRKKLFRYV